MLDQPSEPTINSTAFKPRRFGLMDDLARGRLKRVVVAKRAYPDVAGFAIEGSGARGLATVFPDGKLIRETFFGLTKSLTVLR